ncbi:UPF0481 protein At3g47200-like [Arachis duranensis]|uniref:UPF0481 protein At3g47200-like n=1 Tax=Arachis duranensis TaxID=130453 RepID=A0A9C6TFX4_ARADU|nr:UPF0481 protein At3g47200-like [Arachis duranensis]
MENDVAIEVEAMLEKAQPLFTTKCCCIYKVPHEIRRLNEDAYIPVIVSIGPLHHHGNSRLVTMEGHKQFYCQHFIQRSEASLSDLVSCLQQLEPQIRACYSEKIELTVDGLVKVIFIDCCFVIELFLRNYEGTTEDDLIFSKQWVWDLVSGDLILIENQVPLFVVEKIYNLAFASRLHGGGFPIFMRLASKRPLRNRGPLVLVGHTAFELVQAGLKFQVNKSSHCILDLEFEHGILKIPHIIVDDFTEVLLRNIVALEQCHYPRHHYITDYVYFLAQLVNSNKDANVLIKAGIIESMVCGNDTSVAKLFTDVDKNILVGNHNANYLQICNDLNAFYEHPCRTKIATLRRDYFTTPWKTATSIAGIVLLLLTVIQTVCSILQLRS